MDDAGDDVVLLDYEFDYIIEEDDAAHADGDELDYSGTDSDILPKLPDGLLLLIIHVVTGITVR